jgi:hypothetical protein
MERRSKSKVIHAHNKAVTFNKSASPEHIITEVPKKRKKKLTEKTCTKG